MAGEKKRSILALLCIVLAALLFTQLPQVMEQYQLRLSGHVAELRYQVYLMKETALQSGKSLEEFVQKFRSSSDRDFSSQGELMEAMVRRMELQTQALLALQNSRAVAKPWFFIYYLDGTILKETLNGYTFGLAFTLETVGYLLAGILAGYLLYRLLLSALKALKAQNSSNRGRSS